MLSIQNKEILVDGKPQMIFAGEVHYYRLYRVEWRDRLQKLRESGCNTVATYIPWILHENTRGNFDFNGREREEHDLIGFIKLCQEEGFYIFVRPGPFIMAEMKNDGIPYWVYDECKDAIPVSWDNSAPTTPTLEYLDEGFLKCVRQWYKAIFSEVITPNLIQNGGGIIGVQLDNEIGMLSWVSNRPDLNDKVLDEFRAWAKDERVRGLSNGEIRSPKDEYAVPLHKELGYFMRERYARYVEKLHGYACEFGAGESLFAINVHGTSMGRGHTYPIGLSQLLHTYKDKRNFFSGTDIYLGNLSPVDFQDLYLVNAMTEATNGPEQPLTSVEFECGSGDYGNSITGRTNTAAADHKLRMTVCQGGKLINYYLFCGGHNYRFPYSLGDGNDRVATTGEMHGFAAPISPYGEYNYTFPRIKRGLTALNAIAGELATARQEFDNVCYAFIPDYYMTEYCYRPGAMEEVNRSICDSRNYGAWEIAARGLLFNGFQFYCEDVESNAIPKAELLVCPTTRYMNAGLQQKLADALRSGTNMLFWGELPEFDINGDVCTILIDALEVRPLDKYYGWSGKIKLPTVVPTGILSGFEEVNTGRAQTLKGDNIAPVMQMHHNGECCGFTKHLGDGKVLYITNEFRLDLNLFKKVLDWFGIKPRLSHDCRAQGLFIGSQKSASGARFVHILNLDDFEKSFNIYENGAKLFGGDLTLSGGDGVVLPIGLTLSQCEVFYSTAELMQTEGDVVLRLVGKPDRVLLSKKPTVTADCLFEIIEQDGKFMLTLQSERSLSKAATLTF